MFGKMAYVVKVNAALARLHVDPRDVPAQVRQTFQTLGRQVDLTAQEVAVVMFEAIPEGHMNLPLMRTKDLQKRIWERQGKYRHEKVAAVQEAMDKSFAEFETAEAGGSRAEVDRVSRSAIEMAMQLGAKSAREAAEITMGCLLTDVEWERCREPWERNWS